MGPRAGLNDVKNRNISPLPGIEPRPSSPSLYRLSYPESYLYILPRVLVTLDAGLDRWVDLLDIRQAELQLVVTQSYCNYNTSWLRTMLTLWRLLWVHTQNIDFTADFFWLLLGFWLHTWALRCVPSSAFFCFWFISESQSELELLYDWRFTANQFVSERSPLTFAPRIYFPTEHLRL
jgi:hypothetical protein